MPLFQIVFTGFCVLLSSYLYLRGIRPLADLTGQGIALALGGLLVLGLLNILWLPWVHWRSTDTSPSRLDQPIESGAYLWMGLLSLILFCLLLREGILLVALLLNRSSPALSSISAASAFAGGLLLFALGSWIAARGPQVVRVSLESPAYLGTEPLKIVQISDLHISTSIRRPYVENVVDQVNALNPDLVLFTGDIADGDPDSHDEDLEPLRRLRPKHGSYYSTGNHEFYWNESAWMRKFGQYGLKVLNNGNETIQAHGVAVAIAGVNDTRPDFQAAVHGLPENSFTLLLAHRPEHAEEARKFPIDLQLSGHTHGGQFLPWSLIIGFFHRHPKGLTSLGSLNLYVNVGTGYWGPPLRLGTVSEITEITVSPAGKS